MLGRLRSVSSRIRRSREGKAAGKGGASDSTESPATPGWQRLLDSKIFDFDYYCAQAGQRFNLSSDAAAHCVHTGLPTGLMPSPFLDLGHLPPRVARACRRGRINPLLDYLNSEQARNAVLGPLFDCGKVRAGPGGVAAPPSGALGLFLSTAEPDSPLPVPGGFKGPPPTLSDARSRLIQFAADFAAQSLLTRPRITSTWDRDAEARWKEQWVGVQLPESASPLVSVIMPVRNQPRLVQRALASVQRQSLTDWELLVVDDGSTDETPSVIAAESKRDRRIRLLQRDPEGVSAARNAALSHADGRYVAFLDSDNEWFDDFLEVAVKAMYAQGQQAAYAALQLSDGPHKTPRYRSYTGGLEDLMVVNHVDVNVLVTTVVLAREVGAFDESLRRWVDHDFALRLAKRTPLHLLPYLGCAYSDPTDVGNRISVTEPEAWQFVVLNKHWVDWEQLRTTAHHRVHGRVSVVVPTYGDHRLTIRAVRSVLEMSDVEDIECIIVDNGSAKSVGLNIVSAFVNEVRVKYMRLPRNMNFAIGCNVGFAQSTGSTVFFLNNDTEFRKGSLQQALQRLESDFVLGVQPLLVFPDDNVQTAGTIFPVNESLPCHFLTGHPVDDVLRSTQGGFYAVSAAALAMRATDVIDLRGFDAYFVNGLEDVDLCLRCRKAKGGQFVVEPEWVVTHLEARSPGRYDHVVHNREVFLSRWRGQLPNGEGHRYAALGLDLTHVGVDGADVPAPRPVVTRMRPTRSQEGPPCLRWSLKIPSTPGAAGDVWGDTHFAQALASALRRLGQEVVIYRHGAHNSVATYLDDVALAIRGLDRIYPQPGRLNVLWVISHPGEVRQSELQGFDLVFAASEHWSVEMSELSGKPVRPLLQATDATRLEVLRQFPVGDGSVPVFVGSTHDRRRRKVVEDAVNAGLRLAVYGAGWQDLLPNGALISEYLPNDRVMGTYRAHGVVLADHWPDMAAGGFIANRVFDAVAAGARVICDPVPGVTELFRGAVRSYDSAEGLRDLCGPRGRRAFPREDDMEAISMDVARWHSFDRRAQQLLDAVTGVAGEGSSGFE